MYSVYLADLVGDTEGHFYFMEALSKIENSFYLDTRERKILVKKHLIRGLSERIRIYRNVFAELKSKKGNKIVHFQTGDKFYFIPILFSPERRDCKVVLTLHSFPSHPVMQFLLKNFARKISWIVVLSESLKNQLQGIGIKNVVVIEHPTFYDYSVIEPKDALRRKYGIPDDKIVISALGGTRYDKGLDLLLDSFAYLTDEEKDRIILNIAGRSQDFDIQYITQKIDEHHIRARVDLRNVSNIEFCENVKLSDWMAIPYRRTFNGVSGPMVEAISQGIPCFVPEGSSLHFFCQRFAAAKSFKPEDAKSLAESIKDIVSGKEVVRPSGIEKLSCEHFIKKHIELYNTLY